MHGSRRTNGGPGDDRPSNERPDGSPSTGSGHAGLRLFGFRFVVSFTALFILTLPFPYTAIPNPGELLRPLTEGIIRWAATHILSIAPPFTAAIVSDATGMYVHALVVLALALVGSIVWSVADRSRAVVPPALRYWFHAALSYYLALQLLGYGLNKIFKHQFYLPEPNTLFTTVGQLSRDILYWSAMGSSYGYTVFAGALEVLPAALLLFRRTRSIGAIIASAVMLNVVAVNIGFDISVKLYSTFLLVLCIIVAAPGVAKLYELLVRHRRVDGGEWAPTFRSPRSTAAYAVAKALVIGCIVWESMIGYVTADNFNDDTAPRPFLHGAYAVDTFIRNGDTVAPLLTASDRLKRVFVHRRGYFITQTTNDEIRDYRLAYDRTNGVLHLRAADSSTAALAYEFDEPTGRLLLRGRIGGDSIEVRARRIPLEGLPLFGPPLHWTIDEVR